MLVPILYLIRISCCNFILNLALFRSGQNSALVLMKCLICFNDIKCVLNTIKYSVENRSIKCNLFNTSLILLNTVNFY